MVGSWRNSMASSWIPFACLCMISIPLLSHAIRPTQHRLPPQSDGFTRGAELWKVLPLVERTAERIFCIPLTRRASHCLDIVCRLAAALQVVVRVSCTWSSGALPRRGRWPRRARYSVWGSGRTPTPGLEAAAQRQRGGRAKGNVGGAGGSGGGVGRARAGSCGGGRAASGGGSGGGPSAAGPSAAEAGRN